MSNTLVIGDSHSPYHHPDILPFLDELVNTYKPKHVVHIGDESDIKGVAWHAQHPDCYGPKQEYELTKQFFHEELLPRFPKLKLCQSNHGNRYARMMKAANIPAPLRQKLDLNYIWDVPRGWEWAPKHIIGNTVFAHGDKGWGDYYARARKGLGFNSISGHYHSSGGVAHYTNATGKAYWSAATGCLIDPTAPAFDYASFEPVLGSLIIEEGTPVYCPLKTDKHGRWTGRL